MKKIFTLLFCSLFSLSLLAYDGSKLSISTTGKASNFKIEIDGRKVNLRNNSVTLTNISEGMHNVRIYKEKTRNGVGFDRRPDLIYATAICISKGVHTDITVNRFGKVFIDERRMDMGDEWDNESGISDENEDGWDNSYSNVMNTRDFNIVKEQLRREWAETNRLVSAKVIIDKSNFSAQQIKDIMLLFSFETNRLDLAKYAYRKTADKENYFQLNDALTFNSSKDELARFIRGK